MTAFDLPSAARFLVEADLRPVQGSRFQPTGFPDLGPARFTLPSGTEMLLVESAQSMANRLERSIWDDVAKDVVPAARGLSWVRVERPDGSYLTSTIEEAHRLNSPYVLQASDKRVYEELRNKFAALDLAAVDIRAVARVVARLDINSLLHGLFLAQDKLAGGRIRVPRALSAFVEATDVSVAASGGVKNDILSAKGAGEGKKAAEGYGNVPFPREEFVAGGIVAYFNLDLQQLRAYGLPAPVTQLLFGLALYKIGVLLDRGLRFRTACDLAVVGRPRVTSPLGGTLPELAAMEEALPRLVQAAVATGALPTDPVVRVTYA